MTALYGDIRIPAMPLKLIKLPADTCDIDELYHITPENGTKLWMMSA
jgi:hypothetical protein